MKEDEADIRFFEKHKSEKRLALRAVMREPGNAVPVSILCRFWFEDGVWNGIAEDLPVAAFGTSFEEAMDHLCVAVENHLESILETGEPEDLQEGRPSPTA